MKGGQIGGFRGCVPRWSLGLSWGYYQALWECWRVSALIVHQHSKIAAFGFPCAIAFPRSFNKSVLRGFLGGLFGFIWSRCIFGWLVGFVGLVRLYACKVKRLRSEKRKPANLLDCFAPVFCWLALIALLALFASLVLVVWFACLGCVVGGFLSLWMIATKRKGKRFACPLFVGCGLVIRLLYV